VIGEYIMKFIIVSILILSTLVEAQVKTLPVETKELKSYIKQAQKTLPYFINAYNNHKYKDAYFLLKHKIYSDDRSNSIHLWFIFIKKDKNLYYIKEFELPDGYSKYKNRVIKIRKDDIEDWWVQDGGKLYGAFSIRYQRDRLKTKEEKDKLNTYMGIEEHMTTMP